MKAVVKTDPKPGIDVKEVDEPKIKPEEVLVEVKAVGICGTDVHIYKWIPGFEWLAKWLPVILGHEFSGRVIKVGENVKLDIKEAERITSEFIAMPCGRCFFCKSGRENLCSQGRASRLGLERNGAMAEYVAVPAKTLHKVPNNMSYEEAALTEPASVALHAVELAHITPGDFVAIIGPGPIGLLSLQASKVVGASSVTMIGLSIDRSRLKVAEELGAQEIIIGDEEDPVKRVRKTTGLGADVVIEASGAPIAIGQAIRMVRLGGRVVLVGIYPQPTEIHGTPLVVYEKSVTGSYSAPSRVWNRVLALMSTGRIKMKPLITHKVSLEEAEEGFRASANKKAIKTLIIPR